jgi:hypothetical protein
MIATFVNNSNSNELNERTRTRATSDVDKIEKSVIVIGGVTQSMNNKPARANELLTTDKEC